MAADVELLEDDVPHGHRHGAVGPGGHAQPLVGELGVVRVVGRDHHDLLPVVAGLGHEVGVGRAGQRQVRAPHDEVLGVVPVSRLGDVGLVPEDLRGGRGQVGVPVVEGQHGAADELVEAPAGAVGEHGHGRDDGEAGAAVRPPGADGVDVGGGDDLHGVVPAHAHHAAPAAGRLVGPRDLRVGGDLGPRGHGVAALALLGGPEGVEQPRAHVGVADAGGGVGVPGEGSAARAAAGLVLGHVRARGGVVGDLLLPGDDPVGDVDLPGARAGAVHPVGGVDHLVVAPPVPVEGVGLAPAGQEQATGVRAGLAAAQVGPQGEQGGGALDLRAGSGNEWVGGGGHRLSLIVVTVWVGCGSAAGRLRARAAGRPAGRPAVVVAVSPGTAPPAGRSGASR